MLDSTIGLNPADVDGPKKLPLLGATERPPNTLETGPVAAPSKNDP